jgi:hypothetical protein
MPGTRMMMKMKKGFLTGFDKENGTLKRLHL